MRIVRGVVDAEKIKGTKFRSQGVECCTLIIRAGGHIAMTVVPHLGNTMRQRHCMKSPNLVRVSRHGFFKQDASGFCVA